MREKLLTPRTFSRVVEMETTREESLRLMQFMLHFSSFDYKTQLAIILLCLNNSLIAADCLLPCFDRLI